MNPAPNTSTATLHQASWAFTEGFVPESEHLAAARQAAAQLDVTPMSQGGVAFLTFLTSIVKAETVVEIGTGTGVSTLALLAGMASPSSQVTSIDIEAEHHQVTRRILDRAGYPMRRARLISGDALELLPRLNDDAYDLVLIDGDPLEAVECVAQAARLLRSGGVMVLSQALADGRVADPTNEDDDTVIMREALQAATEMEEFEPILLPISNGLLVARRV